MDIQVQVPAPPPPPLRRPRSPPPSAPARRHDDADADAASDISAKRGGSQLKSNIRTRGGLSSRVPREPQERQGRDDARGREREQDGRHEDRRPRGNMGAKYQRSNRGRGLIADQRRSFNGVRYNGEEDWDAPKRESKPTSQPEEPAPKFTPKPSTPKASVTNQNNVKDSSTNEKESRTPLAAAKGSLATQKKEAKLPIRSISETTPTKKLIPKNYMIELLSPEDEVILSVESSASDCRSKTPGFVCLAMHEKFADDYTALCETYGAACEKEKKYTPGTPGDTFSLLNPEDNGWYRARCLSTNEAALLDAGRVVPLAGSHARLPTAYYSQPEFCCLLAVSPQVHVQVGDNLRCVLKQHNGGVSTVSIENAENRQYLGEGELSRWLPEIQANVSTSAATSHTVATPSPVTPTTRPAQSQSRQETQPARQETQPARQETQPARQETQPARQETQPARQETQPARQETQPAQTTPAIPQVARPEVVHNTKVVLVHAVNVNECYVHCVDEKTQTAFDAALQDTAGYGLSATALKEPPTMGQCVVSKYTDDIHYRALVKRTNVKQNKYLLEYLEFGNSHINSLENLYPLPAHLSVDKLPCVTSRAALRMTSQMEKFTPEAELYLDALKDNDVELLLTLPDGVSSAPSGSEVLLAIEKNRNSVNTKVEQLCTPEWLKLQQRGGDVLETERIMYSGLKFVEIPPSTRTLVVLDFSSLESGMVSACPPGDHIRHVLTTLTEQIGKYCESDIGKEPYLPKVEEVCIAKLPPYPQWFRAVLTQQVGGPGGEEVEVCYIDYGNVERVPTTSLRKMLPEFTRAPALANLVQIEDFPETLDADMVERAVNYLNINDDGHGALRVSEVTRGDVEYTVRAPEFIAAILGK